MEPRRSPRRRAAADAAARDAAVLSKAFVRAADRLGLSQRDSAALLGVSEATLSRVAGGRPIDPASKEGEIALLFLRIFRSLDAVVGGNPDHARAWLHADNRHLGGVPAALIETVPGIVRVAEYLDAMRGKL
jgi:transcriptional regulator with XRE-family HTH domain